MIRVILLCTWFFIFFSSCSNGSGDISVISFNLGSRVEQPFKNNWDNRKPLVVGLIKKELPDIIGFQSVDKSQLFGLLLDCPEYKYVAEEGIIGDNALNPIFYKKSEFDIISKSHFWLSPTPENASGSGWGSQQAKLVTWAKFKNLKTGYIFFVFNALFDSESNFVKEHSALLLLKKIKLIADNAPVMVTGTFNIEPNHPVYELVTGNFKGHYPLWDSETIADKDPDADEVTFNNYQDNGGKKFDYIFINGYFSSLKYKVFPVKKDGVFISDHYPLLVNVVFNAQISKSAKKEQLLEEVTIPLN